jgi:hypothetical protein
MTLTELQKLVDYVTDADGEPTTVLVPSAVWAQVLANWCVMESGLYPIDEDEPKAQILAD